MFELSPQHADKFEDLFWKLEAMEKELGVENFGVELPNLEDVFMK